MALDLSSVRSTERLNATIPGAFPDLSSPGQVPHATPLSQALYERRAEFTRPTDVCIKVGTWNTAAQKGAELDLGAWFVKGKGVEQALAGLGPTEQDTGATESVASQEARHALNTSTVPRHDRPAVPAGEDIDIYVLGLQEIVDITSPTEALRPYTDPSVANKWKTALDTALPKGYRLVAEQQLIGLWLVIYASPLVLPHITNVSTTSVGTGLMGYMGNKGAVTARILLGETTRLVFINSHMAAGADKASLDRRNWDAAQINSRTRFDPIVESLAASHSTGEGLGDEDFAFWFGDLNYRLEGIPGDDVRRLLTVHTKDMDPGSESLPSDKTVDAVPLPPDLDPASLQTTVTSLLSHDELYQQMKAEKAFHDGWYEGPIRFLPSYKYDVGKVGVFDSSEKHRCPSWCDRILYRTRGAKERYDAKSKEREEIRKRNEEMQVKGTGTPADDVLYDYDPDTEGGTCNDYDENEEPEPETIITKDHLSAEIHLKYYTTHMRILSSDHKPLDAVFSLKYDAVVPDLKAAVHAEVVRELDRQENEGRPSITVAVDRTTGSEEGEPGKTDGSFEGVDFGDVKYAKSKKRNITIANTGRVPAIFSFADRPVDQEQPTGPFPPWLSVVFDREPDKLDNVRDNDAHEHFTLEPADVINIEFKLKVESFATVRSLNEGDVVLDEVLVIHVEGGRDHFLPVRANWLQSTLVRSIDKLIRIPEGGIRKLQNQIPSRDEVKWSVPREIFRLTEAIEDMIERTLAEWEMIKNEEESAPWQDNAGYPFVKSQYRAISEAQSCEDELANVFDALDCDTPFVDAFNPETQAKERVELLAEALLTFLSSLTDGVITKSLWEKMEDLLSTREKSKQSGSSDDQKMVILESLASAQSHNATFLLMISFLQNIANQIIDVSKPVAEEVHNSAELPASQQAKVHKRSLSKVPEIAIRQIIVRNYAIVFADVLFRCKDDIRIREKERAIRKERMVKVIELFLVDRG